MKIFEEFEFDSFTNKNAHSDQTKLEYIKEMVTFSKTDKQAVFMYLAFALAVAVFSINSLDQFIRVAGSLMNTLFYSGICLVIVSAMAFFIYWRKVHRYQSMIISCIPRLNAEKTRELWKTLWKENRLYFKLGLWFLVAGCSMIFIISLIARTFFQVSPIQG